MAGRARQRGRVVRHWEKPKDTGRQAYREPGEPSDERPLIKHRAFWTSAAEELRWLWAVEECRRSRGKEGTTEHLERIGRAFGLKYSGPPAKEMARLPYRDPDDDEARALPPPVELTDERADALAAQKRLILADAPPAETAPVEAPKGE